MADTYCQLAGDLNAFQSRRNRNRSQTTICVPPSTSPPKKRASSFYPDNGPEIVDEPNPDPFYLEQSLTNSGSWSCYRRGIRDVRFSEEPNPYFLLSTVNSDKEFSFPSRPRGESIRSRRLNKIDRSTLSVVELELQLSLQQISAQPRGNHLAHRNQDSFSSVQSEATPDLTPSSSFSSNYCAPLYPDTTLPTIEQFPLPTRRRNQPYQTYSTPLSASSTQPPTPNQDTYFNESTETLVLHQMDSHDSQSHRGKPLPSLPANPRCGNGHPSKRAPFPNTGRRPSIEPSMISPPSLINPVTLEPHTTHFDQASFIPHNGCPSPVPSPGPPSPSLTRPVTAPSIKDRPSTSPSAAVCEQSIWESDSDSESLDPRSLRKGMDTLKKVRSRVQLRVAKSTPKLQTSNAPPSNNSQALERFPSMPDRPPTDPFPEGMKAVIQARPSRELFWPSAQQTLRLVAPSTASLVRPKTPRSRRNSSQTRGQPPKSGIDQSTAAAFQARSRRKQRSDSPETSLSTEREKVCTFCREERSDKAIHHSLTLARPPFYKRVWESLRLLGCHGDITIPKSPRKCR